MLGDSARVNAFDVAIRAIVKPGDLVLDLGTGTGILAMLACRAGARRVYALEAGDMTLVAKELLKANGFGDRIKVLQGRSEDVHLPERVDVIVGEIIGNVGFDEGIVGSFIDARERHLKPGGTLIPRRVEIVAAPVTIPDGVRSKLEFWEQSPHGLNYAQVRRYAAQQLYATELKPEMLLADPKPIFAVDLWDRTELFAEGTARYTFASSARVEALGAWFRSELAPDHWLSNAPPNVVPNWSLGLFPICEPITVPAGTTIDVRLSTYDGQIWRWQVFVQRPDDAVLIVDHSTFAGFPLDLPKIRASAPQFAPVLSRRGEATLRILQGIDGHHTSGDLAAMLAIEYVDLFPTEASARTFVSRLVQLCSRSDDA
jgi:protein arginine N-methyltransferase 1